MDGFFFSHPVRVRFAETDAQGIAHHASYVVWLEEARVAYLDAYAGGYKHIREQGIEALTTGVHLEYRLAVGFHDVLRIWTRCVDIRGARFRYEYRVVRSDETIVDAYTTHAIVDRETHRPKRVPAWFVEAVRSAERATRPICSARQESAGADPCRGDPPTLQGSSYETAGADGVAGETLAVGAVSFAPTAAGTTSATTAARAKIQRFTTYRIRLSAKTANATDLRLPSGGGDSSTDSRAR
jgi:acyl-CoA thioester hydrolase